MVGYLKKLMPKSPDVLLQNRVLRKVAPSLGNPDLWKMRQEPVARAAAVGVLFAFVLPFAQIPVSVFVAMLMRLNIPVAVLATFINTPLTFGPVYYFAYLIGAELLNLERQLGLGGFWVTSSAVALGTLVIALSAATCAYFLVKLAWRIKALRRLERRRALPD